MDQKRNETQYIQLKNNKFQYNQNTINKIWIQILYRKQANKTIFKGYPLDLIDFIIFLPLYNLYILA